MAYNPLDNPVIHTVSQRVYTAAKDILGDKLDKVYLYGSYARGDFDEYSDIDYMIIIHLPQAEACAVGSDIYDRIADLDLTYDVIVSPITTGSEIFYRFLNAHKFYKNILDEGVEIVV